ncbi:MAG: ABC transporter permease [Planctomycetes bacterium]|nr:ABC transporter permease [Planctomycetota bacterium]
MTAWRVCLNPLRTAAELWRRREVIVQLSRSEIDLTYRGSLLGVSWMAIQPLVLLAVYATVFLGLWPPARGSDDDHVKFVLGMFCGIVVYTLFSDVVTRAPMLVLGNPSYVKRIVFPLEVLPVSTLSAALLNLGVGLLILLGGVLLLTDGLSPAMLLLPICLLPLVLFTLGLSWFLASLGVFVRDVQQAVRAVMLPLFFISPIFWTLNGALAIAPEHHMWTRLNPLTTIIESFRRVLIYRLPPDWLPFATVTLLSLLVFICGYAWFMKTRHGFADVL